jgi:hypothetical protein
MPKLGGYLVSFAQALRIGVRDGQLTISLFRGSDTMRKVRVSIVIPLLTLPAVSRLAFSWASAMAAAYVPARWCG